MDDEEGSVRCCRALHHPPPHKPRFRKPSQPFRFPGTCVRVIGVPGRARHICARIVMQEGEDRDAFSTTTHRQATDGEGWEDEARGAGKGMCHHIVVDRQDASTLFLTCAHALLSPVAPHAFDRRGRQHDRTRRWKWPRQARP